MNAMTRAAKMLALMPVVALAAACNGVSPASSTDLSRDLSADVSAAEGSATAAGLRNRACAVVAGVDLRVVAEEKRAVIIQASYKYTGPVVQDCPAPVWASRDATLQVDRTNPFRVAVLRTHDGTVRVHATAPNGVSDAITVSLGGPTHSDEPVEPPPPTLSKRPTLSNRPVPTPIPASCAAIDGVAIRMTRPTRDTVSLAATYSYKAPVISSCAIPPTWAATSKGLSVDKDGFGASIATSSGVTAVYVTAPNGVAARVDF